MEAAPACEGKGIVICAGGHYFTSAWISIRLLRELGCRLPIEMWHLGRKEFNATMEALVRPLGVECVDASRVRRQHPIRYLDGWELKSYAIVHSRFREVMLLDADNVATRNPEFLFEEPEYRRTGAVFWPDLDPLGSHQLIWVICGVRGRDEPAFESGQIVVDKLRCWRPLRLALWYNAHSSFFYYYIHGDKDTFHLAFRKLDVEYAMPPLLPVYDPPILYQHDFQGARLFQHQKKWALKGRNRKHRDFQHQDACFKFLRELRRQWDGRCGRTQ